MLTRKMAEQLAEKVQELERLLERQSLMLERFQNSEASTSAASQTVANKYDITRIPDIIKMIPGYDGNVKSLPIWIESVEQKLNCASMQVPEAEKNNAIEIWTSVIRDKISGKANEVLINSQTKCKWQLIKAKLIDRFGDKRDLSSIINKIPYIKQGNQTVEQFYEICAEILADLNAKIVLDPGLQPCAKAVIASYEAMITNAYIDGLHEPISSLTRTSRPESLLSAYQHALELTNAADRKKEKLKFETKFSEHSKTQQLQTIPPRNGGWNLNNNRITNTSRNYPPVPQRPYNPNFRPYQNQNTVRPPLLFNNFPQNRNFSNQFQNGQTIPQIKQEPHSQNNFRRIPPVMNQIHYQEQNEQNEPDLSEAYSYQNAPYPQEMYECTIAQDPQEVHNNAQDNLPTVDDEVNFTLETSQMCKE